MATAVIFAFLPSYARDRSPSSVIITLSPHHPSGYPFPSISSSSSAVDLKSCSLVLAVSLIPQIQPHSLISDVASVSPVIMYAARFETSASAVILICNI